MDKDRAKKLDTVFSQIEKQFGEGSLMKLGADQVRKIPSISTYIFSGRYFNTYHCLNCLPW